jgi:hypothetical protein
MPAALWTPQVVQKKQNDRSKTDDQNSTQNITHAFLPSSLPRQRRSSGAISAKLFAGMRLSRLQILGLDYGISPKR